MRSGLIKKSRFPLQIYWFIISVVIRVSKICIETCAVLCLVAQLCLTLYEPIDCCLPGSSVHEDSPNKNTGVGCHGLFQGIFPIQGLNPSLPHCRQILYWLSHQAQPISSPGDLPYSGTELGSASVVSDSVQPQRWQPTRLFVPGILQARTLEWVAISFSNAWEWKVKVKTLSCVSLFTIPRTTAHQAPPSMGFSKQEYWSGVPLPSPSYNADGFFTS